MMQIKTLLKIFLDQCQKNFDSKKYLLVFLIALTTLGIDQLLKWIFLQGFVLDSEFITFGGYALVFNKGVAFSLLEFLGESLKYLQLFLLLALFVFGIYNGLISRFFVAFGLIFGAGGSNVLDRFIHDGVVDYIYWHYGFEFAIFNFADVMIDIGIGIVLLSMLQSSKKSSKHKGS